jgi:hypothetical protein
MTHLLRAASAAFAFIVVAIFLTAPASAQRAAPIDITLYKGSFVIGIEGGSGTVHYRGRPYDLSIAGLSFGLSVGLSKAELHGHVTNLHRLEDIEGVYNAFQAGAAMVYGGKVVNVKNSKGVVIAVSGDSVGAEFSLDLNGMSVSLR